MSNEEQLLKYWRKLSSEAQHEVLELTRSLQPETDSPDFGVPAHLSIKSRGHLDYLLQEGCDSGDPIEVTEDWWAQKRERLFQDPPQTR